LPLASRLHDEVEKFVCPLGVISPQLLDRFQGGATVSL